MKRRKQYWQMNADELARATVAFDREFVADSFHSLSAKQRAAWERMRGRSRRGGTPELRPGRGDCR